AADRRARENSLTTFATPSPRNRGEGWGEGQGACDGQRRFQAQATNPSPPPSPRRTGKRESLLRNHGWFVRNASLGLEYPSRPGIERAGPRLELECTQCSFWRLSRSGSTSVPGRSSS